MGWHIQVRGRVQGVGFRWYCQRQANALDMKGWVQNLSDGSVAMQVEGTQFEAFLAAVKKGPAFSKVTHCEVKEVEPQGFTDFFIKR